MEKVGRIGPRYWQLLTERAKKSKVYKPHQLVGLTLAELLGDERHKSLYIRLAKKHNHDRLLRLAKTIGEKKNVKNRGAYFMSVFYEKKKRD